MKQILAIVCTLVFLATQAWAVGDLNVVELVTTKDYVPLSGQIRWGTGASGDASDRIVLCIFNSAGNLIANAISSQAVYSSGSIVNVTFSGVSALTPGQTYYIGLQPNNGYTIWTRGSGNEMLYQSGGSFPNGVASLSFSGSPSNAVSYVNVKNAAGQVLIGEPDLSSGGSSYNGIGYNGYVNYYQAGYTCNTL